MSKYGYITWFRGRAEWTPDLVSAKDRYFPKQPTTITKITSREKAEQWWDAVMHYFMRKPSHELSQRLPQTVSKQGHSKNATTLPKQSLKGDR